MMRKYRPAVFLLLLIVIAFLFLLPTLSGRVSSAPIADAGPDQTVPEGSTVQLDGAGSEGQASVFEPSLTEGALPGGTSLSAALNDLGEAGSGTQPLSGNVALGEGAAVPSIALVYVIDTSGSALDPGGCGGDQNGDGAANRILDCEIAAAEALNESAIANGTVAEVGAVAFAGGGIAGDVGPATGVQLLTQPAADANNNGVVDVNEVLSSAFINGGFRQFSFRYAGAGTNYQAGLTASCNALANATAPTRIVAFLSDGDNLLGSHITTAIPCPQGAVTFHSFAVGSGASCDSDPTNRGSLQHIADLTGGSCTEVPDVASLPDILPDVIAAELIRLELSVDGAPAIDISDTVDPPLPVAGPVSIDFTYDLPALGPGTHEICLITTGRDAGGEDSVTTCAQVIEGAGALTFDWQLISAAGPPVQLSSSTSPQPTFLAIDDGVYTFELTVTDGFGDSANDQVTVTVENVDPAVSADSREAFAGGVTLVTASFTDAGWLDTHTASFDWGDGSPIEAVPITAQGAGWGGFFGSHIYSAGGSYQVTITLQDDDGGVASDTITLEAAYAAALWANSETAPKALDWGGGTGTIEGLVHSNNDIWIRGNSKWINGPTEYVTSIDIGNLEPHYLTPTPVQVGVADFPLRFELAHYQPGGSVSLQVGTDYHDRSADCDPTSGKWHVNGEVLPSGVYYADCDVQLNGSEIGGRITLAAEGSIAVSGSRPAFEPFYDGLLFLSGAQDDKAIDISASDSKFLGVLFSELGRIDVSGSDNRFFCGLLADRINLTGSRLTLRGSSCGRPSSTVATPLLVPSLELSIEVDQGTTLPGNTLNYELIAGNSGALLVVPGVIGLENVDVAPATVMSYAYVLEYFSVADQIWVPLAGEAAAADGYTPTEPLPTLGGVELSVRQNPYPGVSYPGAGDLILGTVLEPDGFATWGYQALVELSPEQVNMLLDPAQVGGIRNRVEFELQPSNVQIRRLFTFGTDFVDELLALSGDIADVEITFSPPAGDPRVLTGVDFAGLGQLLSGDAVTINQSYDVPTIEARRPVEPDEGYLARLLAADGAQLFGSTYARATGGVGLLVAPQVYVVTGEEVPALTVIKTGPSTADAGDQIEWNIQLGNLGSAEALSIDVSDELDGAALAVSSAPATLLPAGVDNASATYDIPGDHAGGAINNAVAVNWTDALGNGYGDMRSTATTTVIAAPAISGTLVDTLHSDNDDNGFISPGDVIRYEAVISNSGGSALTGVAFSVTADPLGAIVPASVSTTAGTVTSGNAAGDTVVTVGSVTLAGGAAFTISWQATIENPLPEGVNTLSIQGEISSNELPPVLTDDPSVPGAADPTVTQVIVSSPILAVTLEAELVADPDGNGVVSPGDTVRYTSGIINTGGIAATGVLAMYPPDENTTLVNGSVVTSAGSVTEGNNSGDDFIQVDVGQLGISANVEITFDVTVNIPFPSGVSAIVVQGWATSNELEPSLSDDPNSAAEMDATSLPVFVSGGGGGGGGGGGPAPSIGEISPADGVVATEPILISAQLEPPEGETVEAWRVTYRQADSDVEVEFAAGTGTVVDAMLDPTVMANGLYIITIEAEASGGGISIRETSVVVDGQLKPGRFITTFLDKSVVLGGWPLQVSRTYDSYDMAVGDFGVGWTVDVADFRVTVSKPLGQGGWREEVVGCGLIFCTLRYVTDAPHFVTVTWPDGTNEIFDLTPAYGSTFFRGLTSAAFTARSGSTSELEALDTGLWFSGDGNLYGGLFGYQGIYNPQRFRLTDRFGVEYIIDMEEGLQLRTDLAGNILTFSENGIVSSFGLSLTFERDAQGRITEMTGPEGGALLYTYDASGNLATFTDSLGNVTTYHYDDPRFPNYLTAIHDPLGNAVMRTVFDEDGRVIATCDAEGDVITLEGCETYEFDAGNRVWTTFNGRGFRIDQFLDEQGNVLVERRWQDSTTYLDTVRTYDADNNLLTETDPAGNTWSYSYDADGNLLTRTDPRGVTTQTFTYDGQGRVLTECDAQNHCKENTYDVAGNLRFVEDALGNVTEYRYNEFGQRTEFIDALGNQRQFEYDARGYPSQFIDPDGNAQVFVYNAGGLLQTYIDREGRQIDLEYDAADNLITETWDTVPPRVTTYTYDAAGHLTSVSDPDSTLTMGYSSDGELNSVDNAGTPGAPQVVISLTYDANDNLSRVEDSLGGVTAYTYDFRDLMASTTQFGAGVDEKRVDFVHDDTDSLREMAYFADLAGTQAVAGTLIDYDCPGCNLTLNRIEHVNAAGTAAIHTLEFVRDLSGNILELTDQEGLHTYTYDALNRALTADHADPTMPDEFYTYDAVGNRTTSHLSAAYTYAPGNRLAQDDAFSYQYDAEGRLTRKIDLTTGTVTDFTYDHRGRLIGAHEALLGGTTVYDVTYTYDAANRLIRRTENATDVSHYVYDHVNPIIELDGSGAVVERRLSLPSVDEVLAVEQGGATLWLLTDQVGTVRDVLTDDGQVLEHFVYDSFGNLLAGDAGGLDLSLLFQARDFDPLTGLGNFRARYYDPGIGRFIKEDPQEPYGYDFAGNNPLLFVDPFGESTIIEYKVIIGGRAFSIALHGAHHPWVILGHRVFCVHIQLLTYLVGVRGSGWRIQIPLPFCRF